MIWALLAAWAVDPATCKGETLDACVAELAAAGYRPRPIIDTGTGRYAMVEGPDGVLLEVFEPPPDLPPALRRYFFPDSG